MFVFNRRSNEKTNVRHFILFGGVFCLIREKVIAADACVFICLFFSSAKNFVSCYSPLRRCYKSVTKKTSDRRLPAARLW
jgi:hypothetical protein